MKKRILYGSADYEEIVRKNGYFVDKTAYIGKPESVFIAASGGEYNP